MHHVDVGLGYAPVDWPDEYVAWDLPVLLVSVPERLAEPGDRRRLMAWLAGRGPLDPGVRLHPW
jgi:maleylpyruvate isomerase